MMLLWFNMSLIVGVAELAYAWGLKPHGFKPCGFKSHHQHCDCGRLGNAADCGSALCGFESHRSPN